MTVVSLAQATRRLGIDAKTLRSFLADAQLSLHRHPHDGRKKGLSDEDLQMLARLHLRSLAPFPQEPPASSADELPTLPAALLALPEQLGALQAQITALQQQVAALTHLLQQHVHPPASPADQGSQASTQARAPCSTRSFSRLCGSQAAPQADSCLTSRRVWQGGTLRGDLS